MPTKETKQDEEKEAKTGVEYDEGDSYDSTEEVPIPEEFQRKVKALIAECDNKDCLSFIRTCVYEKEEDLRKAEMKKESKGKTPKNFSTEDMPVG